MFAAVAQAQTPRTTTHQASTKTTTDTKAPQSSGTSGAIPKTASTVHTGAAKSRTKGRKSSKPSKKKRVRGQREIEPSRVQEIQQALRSAGYYQGEPNGQWDASTTQAMSAYQTANGFKVTGKPDALSLKKLGL